MILTVKQGATFSHEVELLDDEGAALDMTGVTPRGQIRKHYASNTKVDFVCTNASNILTLSLTANTTAAMTAGRYNYDVELAESNGTVRNALSGIFVVQPEVTR